MPVTTTHTVRATTSLDAGDYATAANTLAATDRLLDTAYPGDSGSRQPIHTVYVPGDQYHAGVTAEWGEAALGAVAALAASSVPNFAAETTALAGVHEALDQLAALQTLTARLGVPERDRAVIAERTAQKLASEPIEDLRIDFEDGFGDRGDEAEDAAVVRAARELARDVVAGTAPPFVGIRFKSFEAPTRERGIRTLDLFVTTLVDALGPDSLPDGLILTLPMVTTVAQVEAMVALLETLEARLGLEHGRLTFEVQVETPQLIIAADGTVPVAQLLHRGAGRITGLHYGTYDYSASLGIAAAQQSMEHSAADFAKQVMQVATAGTGVRLSDGSTNVIPGGDVESAVAAWQLHSRLVRRSLERAYYQGWDLHPAHLPSRFIASYAFFRDGLEQVMTRLRNYVEHNTAGFLDEPATARALAGFLARGVAAGAVSSDELQSGVGITEAQLVRLAYPGR
ncbi:DUF6986 family protein [Leucobacter sp. HY1908]